MDEGHCEYTRSGYPANHTDFIVCTGKGDKCTRVICNSVAPSREMLRKRIDMTKAIFDLVTHYGTMGQVEIVFTVAQMVSGFH